MRSQVFFLVTSILLGSMAVLVAAQEPETLGDVAKRSREEKAARANSSQLREPEAALPDMVSEMTSLSSHRAHCQSCRFLPGSPED
jgi:hypothetical protein